MLADNNSSMSEQYVVPMKIDSSNIRGRIYTIRGVQVLLDSDLAELYHVETRRINESVKRNPKRFPSGFCFELTQEEYELLSLKSHNATSNGRGGRRKLSIIVLLSVFVCHILSSLTV